MESGAVNMFFCKARGVRRLTVFGTAPGVGATISTELFNDFKAQSANFKSCCPRPVPVSTSMNQ
jgi:hypothetical protein